MKRGKGVLFGLGWLVALGSAQGGVDLTITEIRFSNETPREGDPVTLTAVVKNVGTEPLTENYDVDVWFFEGDPDAGALQIQALESQAGLRVNQEKSIRAKFRPRAGRTLIHAIVNPDPATSKVIETNRANNEAQRPLVAAARTFPPTTPEQRRAAVERGVRWLLSQQGEIVVKCPQDGTENPVIVPNCVICRLSLAGLPTTTKPSPAWSPTESGPAATSLAVLTLLAAGMKPSDPPLAAAIDYLLAADWNLFDVYDLSVIIPALVATGEREKYLDRVQFAVDRLVDKQLRVEKGHDPRDDGGWGYGLTADGAHMQYAVYALYHAKQWGAHIPPIVWKKVESWVRSTQHHLGGWNYNLVDSPWAEGPYGSMTATGVMALKMVGVPPQDAAIVRGLKWIEDHYTVTSNPGSFSWHAYYLLTIQRALDTPPKQETIGPHDWYNEMADYFVASQYPDGRWEENGDAFNTTAFAILFLSRYTPKAERPDLSLLPSSIRTTPATPVEGTPVTLRFTVTNLGRPVEMATVTLSNGNGTEIASQRLLFPPGRADASGELTWKAPQAGVYELALVADPKRTLNEFDRTNNRVPVRMTVLPSTATAEERAQAHFKELAPHLYQIGAALLDRNRLSVRVPGRVRLLSGYLEYLATGVLGKVHETLLTLDVDAVHLQTALLGLGLEPKNNLRVQGDTRVPEGDPVDVWVSWTRDGKEITHRAEELVYDVANNQPMRTTSWVFTGSRFQKGIFRAEATQSLIALYRDPDALLNHPLPEGADDQAFRPNVAVLPPVGTPITLTIKPAHVP